MENDKMILFSDYLEDKKELRRNIEGLLHRFLNKYPVKIIELPVKSAPGLGDTACIFNGIEIIVK
ncbi:hypothetical protein LCGC14_0463750 [marine sediment metagenome]|uniref:Uncharacterized protein n=1 Tax=marine sediment metagenome TaxID=412755 RepID=A0A0F9SX36_9ZZZZ